MMQRGQAGFSLLELVGVMAVVAIMAGALAPNLADSIDTAYSDAERQNLKTLAESLQEYILEQKRIPSPQASSWVDAIASVSTYSKERIRSNDKGYRRRLLFDPGFFTGGDKKFKGYVQGKGLNQQPVSPRMMLISDMTRHTRNVKNKTAVFDAIWNRADKAVLKEGDDLIIERINLAGKFHRIILSNQNSKSASYRLESGSNEPVPRANGGRDGSLTRYVLHNSRIALFAAPYPSGDMQQVAVVKSDYAMRYQSTVTGVQNNGKKEDDDKAQSAPDWVWVKP